MEERYNGWTNRETWVLHLWLANTEELYRAYRGSSAQDLKQDMEDLRNTCLVDPIPNKKYLEMFMDVGSLWRVNWEEIAESWPK